MANGHGGARPGAGRKKKALSEKILDGNPGKAQLTKLQFGVTDTDMHGEDMPPVSEYLKQVTKNSQQNLAPQIYEDTWRWLKERGCAQYVTEGGYLVPDEFEHTLVQGLNENTIVRGLAHVITTSSGLHKIPVVSKVVVTNLTVTFVFYNGAKISRTYDNGQPGNKPGWNKKKEVA